MTYDMGGMNGRRRATYVPPSMFRLTPTEQASIAGFRMNQQGWGDYERSIPAYTPGLLTQPDYRLA